MARYKYIPMLSIFLVLITLTAGCTGGQQPSIIVEKFTVCADDYQYKSLSIGGDIVVWADNRSSGYNVYGIYGFNLITNTEFLISAPGTLSTLYRDYATIVVGDTTVVWRRYSEETGSDIWGYDLETGTIYPVCTEEGTQSSPRISGDTILWQNKSGNIFAYNIVNREVLAIPLSQPVSGNKYDFNGSIIVWSGFNGIYGYDVDNQNEFVISSGHDKEDVRIGGSTIIWVDRSPTSPLWDEGRAGDIIAYDLTTQVEFRLPRRWAYIGTPAVDGDFIVWAESDENGPDIYGYDIRTGVVFPICVEEGRQYDVAISGNTVVWRDGREGKSGIYGARISRSSN